MAMKIYFAGSIKGGREDTSLYVQLIEHLKKYGQVLTEHVANKGIYFPEENASDERIHDQDFAWLLESDVIIAEVTAPSLGVGYELGRAVELKKKILCLYRPQEGKRLSSMIAGSKGLTLKHYTELPEALNIIDKFFAKQ